MYCAIKNRNLVLIYIALAVMMVFVFSLGQSFAQGAPRDIYVQGEGLNLKPDPHSKVISPGGYQSLSAKALQKGQVKVIFKVAVPPGANRDQVMSTRDAIMSQLDSANKKNLKHFQYIPYSILTVDKAALDTLLNLELVEAVEEDVAEPLKLDLSVPRIRAPEVWSQGYNGSGWVVAILDTGVDKDHSFLTGKVVSEACYSTNNGSNVQSLCPGAVESSTAAGSAMPYGGNCPPSECDHGTHVAGIAAGYTTTLSGVAPGASLIAIQVFSRFNNQEDCNNNAPCVLSYVSDQVRGLERVYALRNSYNVASANMSLGGGEYTDQASCDSSNGVRKAIIDLLRTSGIATVISSGNSSKSNALGAPGCISSAVSVGATKDDDTVATYSNSASFLSLLAPGSSINSSVPNNSYASWSGTSMAAPHVSGAWSMLKQYKDASPSNGSVVNTVSNGAVSEILAALQSDGVNIMDTRNGITKSRIDLLGAKDALSSQVLYSNGQLFNSQGTGAAGADQSIVQNSNLNLSVYGFSLSQASGNRIAEDFTVPSGGWTIYRIIFYAYQNNSTLTSPITGVNFRIWDGPPGNEGSSVIFGDTSTNRLLSSVWVEGYRTFDTNQSSTDRPIMAVYADASGATLPAGTYWLDWQLNGSLSSGPWAPPITITGQTDTGNAKQYVSSSGQWVDARDSSYPQGFPFKLLGTGLVVSSYNLMVTKSGTGSGTVTSNPAGINCGSTCSATYTAGTEVTLTPSPESGSTFAGWGGDCSGVSVCTVTMNSAKNVTATFNSTGSQCVYTLNPTTKDVGYRGRSISVRFTVVGSGCGAPEVVSNVEWMTGQIKSFSNNKGVVKVTVMANNSSQGRSGTVDIGGSEFTVNQAGAPCKIENIEPVRSSYTNAGGNGDIVVTAPEGCNWTAETDSKAAGWVEITGGATGSGSGGVNYTVAENKAVDAKNRSGKVIIISVTGSKKTHTVKQSK